jgi:hypothetical protein
MNLKFKTVKFTPSNFLYSPWHITFAEPLPVETNAIKAFGLQLDNLTFMDATYKLSNYT